MTRWNLELGRQPDVALLTQLIAAYTRSVPWESAFRIAKRYHLSEQDPLAQVNDFPRWPEEFWTDALDRGGGGTCFESNYAFFSLLLTLGYRGYLTINNMGESIACHTAIVLNIDGLSWIADVGLPLYGPLPLNPDTVVHQQSAVHRYTVRPDGDTRYQVERDRHPQPYCFTLIDEPVSDSAYRAAASADYGPDGLFLDRVIISKIIGDSVWRFDSGQRPFQLESFRDGRRESYPLEGDLFADVASSVAGLFCMDTGIVQQALSAVTRTRRLRHK